MPCSSRSFHLGPLSLELFPTPTLLILWHLRCANWLFPPMINQSIKQTPDTDRKAAEHDQKIKAAFLSASISEQDLKEKAKRTA